MCVCVDEHTILYWNNGYGNTIVVDEWRSMTSNWKCGCESKNKIEEINMKKFGCVFKKTNEYLIEIFILKVKRQNHLEICSIHKFPRCHWAQCPTFRHIRTRMPSKKKFNVGQISEQNHTFQCAFSANSSVKYNHYKDWKLSL